MYGLSNIAAIQYASPELIPANLRKVALVLDNGGSYPVATRGHNVTVYQPGSTISPNLLTVGAVLYAAEDTIPADLIKMSGFNPNDTPLLNDSFNGVAIDTGIWTVADSTSKLSVTGSELVWSAGLAGYGDPGVGATLPQTRRAGLTLEAKIFTSSNTALTGPYLVWSTLNPLTASAHRQHSMAPYNTKIRTIINGTGTDSAITFDASTYYYFRMVLKAAGCTYYFSTDGATWTQVADTATGNAASLYPVIYTASAEGKCAYIRVYQGG